MAILKQRLSKRNADGGYDPVYLETGSDIVFRPDGTTVEAAIVTISNTVKQLSESSAAPTDHASSHAAGGDDPVTPESIGAAETGHNHDDTYAAKSHGHTEYSVSSHMHAGIDSYEKSTADSTIIGSGITHNNDYSAKRNIIIGHAITVGDEASKEYASNGIYLGYDLSDWGNGGITIGRNIVNSHGIAIGNDISKATGNITIGSGANERGLILIGSSSYLYGTGTIGIGRNIRVGKSTSDAGDGIAIGSGTTVYAAGGLAIGAGAQAGSYAERSVAIGKDAATNNPDTIQLGDSDTVSALKCKVALTTTSDERDKTDITPVGDGAVEFLKNVQPVRYVWNGRSLYIADREELSEEDRDNFDRYGMCTYDKEAHARGDKKGSRIRVGVLAQQVQKALKDVYGDDSYGNLVNNNFFDYDPKDIPEGVENQLGVTYENFIPFLIKAVQELSARLEALENK